MSDISNAVSKYITKPVEVEAIQYSPTGKPSAELIGFLLENGIDFEFINGALFIQMRVGKRKALPGDWIVKYPYGEICPCKSDAFAQTYQAVQPGTGDITAPPPTDREKQMEEALRKIASIITRDEDRPSDEIVNAVHRILGRAL